MRIALVASLVSPIREAAANGPHAIIVDLARGLTARGHDATVYAAAGSVAAGVKIVGIDVAPEGAGANVRAGQRPDPAATAALNRGFADLFARLRADAPDVVSQHAFDAAAIEMTEGMPVLHTLHLPPIADDIVAAARATSASLATVSRAARAGWEQVGVAGVSVIRNGVPPHDAVDGPVLPIAVIAGRISPEKGTDLAIRVARRAGLAPLVVGDAYDHDYFADRVQPLLRPREWLGAVSRQVLLELMARSTVLLMPVRWDEPFGLVAAEAQMMGCPVVGFRRGALPEVVPHGIGGWLVEPEDDAGLVGAVRAAGQLDRQRIRGRAKAEFSAERMVSAYESALVAVAGRSVRLASDATAAMASGVSHAVHDGSCGRFGSVHTVLCPGICL